jgi:hypothetical protein
MDKIDWIELTRAYIGVILLTIWGIYGFPLPEIIKNIMNWTF